MLPRQLQTGEDVFLPIPGGAIFNRAISLGRLGEEVGFISGISTGLVGNQLIEALKESHVSTNYYLRNHNGGDLGHSALFLDLLDLSKLTK